MTTTHIPKPSRRLLIAIFGYLLFGFAAKAESLGDWALPAVAVLCLLYAPLALRAAAPGLVQRPRQKRTLHPVQTGKARLTKREHEAMLDRV
jgi:hypothetical protein